MQVHHLHYKSLGSESQSDVQVSCGVCHAGLHGKIPDGVMLSGILLKSMSDAEMNELRNDVLKKIEEAD